MLLNLTLRLNGEERTCQAEPSDSLAQTLREKFGLTGTKRGCDTGGCGACTVLLDKKPVYSCMMPTWKAEGHEITTIEGLAPASRTELTPLQQIMIRESAFQCGYCTSAMVLTGEALIESHTDIPSVRDVKEAICGVICRCTDYEGYITAIIEAAKAAAKRREL